MKTIILCSLLLLIVIASAASGYAALTSVGEINVVGDDQGVVVANSTVTLIVSMTIDRTQSEPGEEIRTIEIALPNNFIADTSNLRSIRRDGGRMTASSEISGNSLRIVFVTPISDFSNAEYQITFDCRTPGPVIQTATFRVRLRNPEDSPIGEFIKPGQADGKVNNDDFTLDIIPNVPPAPVPRPTVKRDAIGDNDVTISWQESNDPDVIGYLIYRDSELLVDIDDPATTVHVDLDVSQGLHIYSIEAYKTKNLKSEPSRIARISVPPDTAPPQPPVGVEVADSGNAITVTWTNSPSLDVRIYRVSFGASPKQLINGEILGEILADSKKEDSSNPNRQRYEFSDRRMLGVGIFFYAVIAIDEAKNESAIRQQDILEYRNFNIPIPPELLTDAHPRVIGPGYGAIAYSPDGSQLAAASHGRIFLYDTAKYQDVELRIRDNIYVYSVAFSPDGRTLASAIGDSTIRLWDTITGAQKQTLEGHTDVVSGIAFSPDGNTLASASFDYTVRLWNAGTGVPKHTLHGHAWYVYGVAFSPNGQTLASASGDRAVRLWDAKSGRPTRTLTGHIGAVQVVAFSPDGTTLASGAGEKLNNPRENTDIRLWDAVTGDHKRTLFGHTKSVYSLAFTPNSQTLASGSIDGTIRLWNVVTGATNRVLNSRDWLSRNHIAFSPDGKTLASADRLGVSLWEGVANTRTAGNHRAFSIAFSPDSKILATGSYDNTIYLWTDDIALPRSLEGHTDWVTSVAFNPNGEIIASGSFDKTVRLWNAVTGVHRFTLHGHTEAVISVAISPDGRTLASASIDKTVRLYDAVTGAHKHTLDRHTDLVSTVAFSPGSRTLASGSHDKTIRLWNTNTGTEMRTLYGHTDGINSIAFSPDGDTLASGSGVYWNEERFYNAIFLWDVSTGTHKKILGGHKAPVKAVAFSPDGRILASGSRDTTIRLWDLDKGEHERTLRGYVGEIYRVTFSPNQRTLASCSADGTVLLWELSEDAFPHFEPNREIQPQVQPEKVMGDVNGDGVVNIQDLVAVAANFGKDGQNDTDVNGDGVVNVKDLVLVAGVLADVGAAATPSAHSDVPMEFNANDVKRWLDEARGLDHSDTISQRGILFLKTLLTVVTPIETQLLANFPNPFNPETWIPYQLAKPSEVTLTIYSLKGKPIRILTLGHQDAGLYQIQNRAAYWDGTNNFGEEVASGIYYYTLTTEDYTATRKMLIRK